MARTNITENQIHRDYCFHAVQHACWMMNHILTKVNGKLTTSFEFVHHVLPVTHNWFPLFSIVYFYKTMYDDQDRTSF